ncbi:MAG: hypothetical protein KDH96_02720, partial [Candidatus Riesia sp.]|nr:hypothetical protein [Candidatus Riesia sp.]
MNPDQEEYKEDFQRFLNVAEAADIPDWETRLDRLHKATDPERLMQNPEEAFNIFYFFHRLLKDKGPLIVYANLLDMGIYLLSAFLPLSLNNSGFKLIYDQVGDDL